MDRCRHSHRNRPRPASASTCAAGPAAEVTVRHHGRFAYVAGQLADGSVIPLCRLRYTGYARDWGFAIYRASHDDYQDGILPSGLPTGSPEEALDTACGLYLNDPTAWTKPPTN
jgi:hypothetical protein